MPLGDESGLRGPGQATWRLRAGGAHLSRKEYRESQVRPDDRSSGHVGPRWLIGRDQRCMSLLLSGLHQWTGSGIEEPSHHDIGFRVEGYTPPDPIPADDAERAGLSPLRHERRKYDEQEPQRDGPIPGPMSRGSARAGWRRPTLRIDAGSSRLGARAAGVWKAPY